ncbi:MAG: hypothetical protein KGQ87_06920 [Verrucomicrobia bacterium]|nr:hypothetical protein [Verrucomicrobiota bacterium]
MSIIVVLSAAWWFSPEQVIKRRSISFFEVLTIDLSKPPTTRALAVYSLHPYLAPEVEVSTPTPEEANGTFAREELESAFSSICQHALQCRFSEPVIEHVKVEGKRARVELILKAKVEFPEMRIADGPFRVKLDWLRGEKDWLLEQAAGEPVKNAANR